MLCLLHNDLDAASCAWNIQTLVKIKKFFFTNYANLTDIVNEVIDYAEKKNHNEIIIADVSMSDNQTALDKLYDYFVMKQGGGILYIDHHMYADGFFDKYSSPGFKCIWDNTKSAGFLCRETFTKKTKYYDHKLNQFNANLTRLTILADVYDCWRTDHPWFDEAQDLNEYFFFNKQAIEENVVNFGNKLRENNFELFEDYPDFVKELHESQNKVIANMEDQHRILRMSKDGISVTLVMSWDCFNPILISEMKKGVDFVIGVNAYGTFKVRINGKSKLSLNFKKMLRKELVGNENFGHPEAFTYRIKDLSYDNIQKESNKIVSLILKYKNL